jgi:Skp family chaperone for outer membrane proteins
MGKWIGLLALSTLLIAGCQRSDSSPAAGNVAVVDMEQIAQAIGFDKALGEQMSQHNQQIGKHLQQVQTQMRSQLEQKQKEIGQTPTAKQQSELEDLSNQLDQRYREELNKAQQSSNQMHTSLIGQFRQKVEPIAQTVARERGFDIVMTRTDSILMVSPRSDLTSDVLKWLKQPGQTQGTTGGMSLNPSPSLQTTDDHSHEPMTPAQGSDTTGNASQPPAQTNQPQDNQPVLPMPDKLPVE